MKPWIPTKRSLPPDGKVVETKVQSILAGHHFLRLKREGKSWLHPEGINRVNHKPTHWREISEGNKRQ
jgi:hypothetical protein